MPHHFLTLYQGFKAVRDLAPDDAVVVENVWAIVDAEDERQAILLLTECTPSFCEAVEWYTRPRHMREYDESWVTSFLESMRSSPWPDRVLRLSAHGIEDAVSGWRVCGTACVAPPLYECAANPTMRASADGKRVTLRLNSR